MNKSKLLKLCVKNFRSFKDRQCIDFTSPEGVRKVTAVYGPNGGGKTNIFLALGFIRAFIKDSNNAQAVQIAYQPFLLNSASSRAVSEFEIEFMQSNRHFIYGFSVTNESVEHEYLREFASTVKKSRLIFERKNGELNPTAEKYGFGKKLMEGTRSVTLLITKARENNNEYANLIFDWIQSVNLLTGSNPQETMQWSITQLNENPKLKEEVLNLLNEGDLWIRSFYLQPVDIPPQLVGQLPFNEEAKRNILANKGTAIRTNHYVRDKGRKVVGEHSFDLQTQESSGTLKFFALAAPLLDTLKNGKVLYIDEFESSLHQDMCHFIVSKFKSPENKQGAQLIINTHNTALMSQGAPLQREDIVFVEKNLAEESVISALSDKSVRPDESFEKRYRQGLYGAKPQLKLDE